MRIGIVTETYPPEINGVALTCDRRVAFGDADAFVDAARATLPPAATIAPPAIGQTATRPAADDHLARSLP